MTDVVAVLVLFVVLAVLGAIIAGIALLAKVAFTRRPPAGTAAPRSSSRWTDDDEIAARNYH